MSIVQSIQYMQDVQLSGCCIYDEDIDDIAYELKNNTTWKKLDLSNNNISTIGIITIANALCINTTVTDIILTNNIIRYDSMLMIGNVLSHCNSTIQYINFDDCNIGDREISVFVNLVFKNKRKCCYNNNNLKSLSLVGNRITDIGLLSLADAIQYDNDNDNSNNNITSSLCNLDLRFNKLSYNGINRLAQTLSCQNCSLQRLELDGNTNIGNIGAIVIGQSLLYNTSLHYLGLGGCSIGNDGFICILHSLCTANNNNNTSSLIELDLQLNNISDDGAIVLSKVLIDNKKFNLKKLHLQCNDISDVGAVYIGKSLQYNTSLVYFNISDNIIKYTGIYTIVTAMQYNTTLHTLIIRSVIDNGYLSLNERQYIGSVMTTTASLYNNTLLLFELEDHSVENEVDEETDTNSISTTTTTTLDCCTTGSSSSKCRTVIENVTWYSIQYQKGRIVSRMGQQQRLDEFVWLLQYWV